MGAVATVPAFLDALHTNLAAATGMTGVAVFTAPVGAESMGKESVILATEPVVSSYSYETMPRVQVYEEFAVDGFIWINKPGADETAIAAARDRAYAILEAVHDYVAGLVGKAATQAAVGVDHIKVTGHELEQMAGDGERHVFLKFTIEADAYFDPA